VLDVAVVPVIEVYGLCESVPVTCTSYIAVKMALMKLSAFRKSQ